MLNKLPQHMQDRIMPEPMSGCWLWTGGVSEGNYRQLDIKTKTKKAHRVVFFMLKGIKPTPGKVLDHICRVHCCVNPDHLREVTSAENTHYGESFAAVNARKTHCPQSHPYSGDNLLMFTYKGQPNRVCRICKNLKYQRYMAHRKQVKS